ncbi:MAG: hypothetical protein AABZ60_08305 [Planctomycetota bacterium]
MLEKNENDSCLEGVPAWLCFLESKTLIDESLQKNTLQKLLSIHSTIEMILEKDITTGTYRIQELQKAWKP